jgi:hypothetical protein
MGVLETAARIAELGGAGRHATLVSGMRARFEARTGAFSPEDGWFEERSRAFWSDSVTTGRFGRLVEAELTEEERRWLGPLERAHRGLFRAAPATPPPGSSAGTAPRTRRTDGLRLVDVWSGAELVVTLFDDASRAELGAAAGQLVDGRVVGAADPLVLALLPGAVFHPRHATAAIDPVVRAARERALTTHEALDALLRMERTLRALSRVKAGYAYRPEALAMPSPTGSPHLPVRRPAKAPT